MSVTQKFEPTEIWTPAAENFRLGEAIERARAVMNSKDPEKLIADLKANVQKSENGIRFAVLKGEQPQEYSETDALVMFNPFANTATPNMLVRAEFIREVAKQANVRDKAGKLRPVIMLAAPGILGSHIQLDRADKQQIRKGNLGPAVQELLKAVTAQNFGRLALLGFSQGADLAITGARSASYHNLDVDRLGVGDPAAVKERRAYEIALDFFKSGGQFDESIQAGRIDAQQKAVGARTLSTTRLKDYARFTGTSLLPTNLALWKALSRDTLEANLQDVLDNGVVDKIVVGYGSDSHVSLPEVLEPTLARLHQNVGVNRLISVRVDGKDHSWGDQLPLLAKLYLEALT